MAKDTKKSPSSKSDKDDDDEIEGGKTDTAADEGSKTPKAPKGEPASPPAAGSSNLVKIEGEGTISLMINGEASEIERGKPVKVSDEELAALNALGETVTEV